ncbi:uncharacterized protein LOC135483800 isoform X2 [Lineus longissimus]|uniref:uncharacterized protein LOC135483800 isoform X2 n=1 Tax=Lineus longissimus TaxID=88925 RepID=UPI00315CBDA5
MSSATLASSSSAPTSGTMNKIDEEEKEEEPPTFITVLFGDNQKAIFNPRCRSQILLEFIRRKCNCENEAIDLIDFEGVVKNLSSAKLFDYAHEHQSVGSRESYVLVRVESEKKYNGKREKEQTKFVPLLNNLEAVNPELHDKLNNIVVERPKTREDKSKNLTKPAPKTRQVNPPSSKRMSPPAGSRRGSRNLKIN